MSVRSTSSGSGFAEDGKFEAENGYNPLGEKVKQPPGHPTFLGINSLPNYFFNRQVTPKASSRTVWLVGGIVCLVVICSVVAAIVFLKDGSCNNNSNFNSNTSAPLVSPSVVTEPCTGQKPSLPKVTVARILRAHFTDDLYNPNSNKFLNLAAEACREIKKDANYHDNLRKLYSVCEAEGISPAAEEGYVMVHCEVFFTSHPGRDSELLRDPLNNSIKETKKNGNGNGNGNGSGSDSGSGSVSEPDFGSGSESVSGSGSSSESSEPPCSDENVLPPYGPCLKWYPNNSGVCNVREKCCCAPGYKRDSGNTEDCIDIDECTEISPPPCGPNRDCENGIFGNFSCGDCHEGYERDENDPDSFCHDINECADAVTYCGLNAYCFNTEGDYDCQCAPGYTGTPKTQKDCSNIDECTVSNPCSAPEQQCIDRDGSYWCSCVEGYRWDGTQCINIDECAELSPNPCGPNTGCTDNEGGFSCPGVCDDPGYEFVNGFCNDINECAAGSPCGNYAYCFNTEGDYNCQCAPGYTGSPKAQQDCSDINECSGAPCGSGQRCVDLDGSYACACAQGYLYDGTGCVGEDPCSSTTCDENACCTDVLGSAVCDCNNGFTGDGQSCAPITCSDCAENTSCDETGIFTVCECIAGYDVTSAGDEYEPSDGCKITCDLDPCPTGITCIEESNEEELYKCGCPEVIPTANSYPATACIPPQNVGEVEVCSALATKFYDAPFYIGFPNSATSVPAEPADFVVGDVDGCALNVRVTPARYAMWQNLPICVTNWICEPGTTGVTWSLWMYFPGNTCNLHSIMSSARGGAPLWGILLGCAGGNFAAFLAVETSPSIYFNGGSAIPYKFGVWFHFAMALDLSTNELCIWIDGTLMGVLTFPSLGGIGSPAPGEGKLFVGPWFENPSPGTTANYQIDEFSVYLEKLSLAQIMYLANNRDAIEIIP